jgi:N-acetyl-anhydromuramyl-L-alanine amidase AmpD
MRKIDKIIIHCSASPNGRHTTVDDIDAWHRARGFRRTNPLINSPLTSIGYHFVIYTDGSVHTGRAVEEVGAHVGGHNAASIGICMVGTDAFMSGQWDALAKVIANLKEQYPDAEILGHRDIPGVKKTCPGFDVKSWLKELEL